MFHAVLRMFGAAARTLGLLRASYCAVGDAIVARHELVGGQ